MSTAFLSAHQVTMTDRAAGMLLDNLKNVMRIKTDAFDAELNDLFSAAQADLRLAGVSAEKAGDVDDPLIRRAIFTYVKAHFGWDNPDHERLLKAYDLLKMHLALSQEYTEG